MAEAVEIDSRHHRKLAAQLFNQTWDLIDKTDRTIVEDDRMLHRAHASRYHWECVDGHKPHNLARGEWQISRVYVLLGRAEPALHHAQRYLDLCAQHGIADWDIAFAHEALARAHAVAGNRREYERHFALAKELGAKIVDDGDRDHLFEDLEGGPWFGMR